MMRGTLLAIRMHLGRLLWAYLAAFILLALIACAAWASFLRAPLGFPTGTYIVVAPGTSVSREATLLKDAGVIESPLLFKGLVRAMGTKGVQSGTYAFPSRSGVLLVAWNIAHGISGIPTARITIPEGTASAQIATLLASRLPGFDPAAFRKEAQPYEGYLFPDTYFFAPATTPDEVVARMRANYEAHIAPLRPTFDAFGKSEQDIVTMASILEAEGKTMEDRRVIAGILWKRLSLGMPLQVDASFGYERGIAGYVPTAKDLAEKTAYNTYRRKGLPPTPINNPGEGSILAAITPTATKYLYYLTGTDGTMHYAATLAEHVANEKEYLK